MSITRHQAVNAYKRWVPPSFDGVREISETHPEEASHDKEHADSSADTASTHEDELLESEPPIVLPTADDIEQMYEQARTEGHSQGLAEGLETGFADGKRAADEEAEHLRQLHASLVQSISDLNEEVANEVLSLAVALARQMVGQAVESTPEATLHVIREALLQLPHNRSKLHVHPSDADLIRQHLGEQLDHGHHQLMEDESIARGGCRIEATGCDIDATMPTRWRRVLEAIGQETDDWGVEDWGL